LKIGTALVELDSTKILREDETEIVLPGILVREGVFIYSQGRALRPREELKQSLETFEIPRVIAQRHPDSMILTGHSLIVGKVKNVVWDEENGLVHGEVHINKKKVTPEFLAGVKTGVYNKNSIGFIYTEDWTKGTFNNQPYDFVQRNILADHLAIGVPNPRDPNCILGVDTINSFSISLDPWEETADYIRSGHKAVSETCRTITLSDDQGIKAIYCKYGDTWDIASYLFARAKDWTMDKAKSWFSQHQDALDALWETAHINDLPDSSFAYIEGGGKKDEEGKTVPRSLRHLPFKNAQGQIDHDHLVNALARVSQSGTMPEGGKTSAKEKLCNAVRSWNREHSDSKIQSDVCGVTGDCLLDAIAEIERFKKLVS